ncbi:hypothetical protein Tco_0905894 [Tanacetum coccineum]
MKYSSSCQCRMKEDKPTSNRYPHRQKQVASEPKHTSLNEKANEFVSRRFAELEEKDMVKKDESIIEEALAHVARFKVLLESLRHIAHKNFPINQCTPMATSKLDADLHGTQVDQTKYRSMIGGLMYLTASRPDIAFATFDADHAGCDNDCKSTSRGYISGR